MELLVAITILAVGLAAYLKLSLASRVAVDKGNYYAVASAYAANQLANYQGMNYAALPANGTTTGTVSGLPNGQRSVTVGPLDGSAVNISISKQVDITVSWGYGLSARNGKRKTISAGERLPMIFSNCALLRRNRGMTLIELLVVMSVVATLLFAVLGIFRMIVLQWSGQVSRSKAILAANLGIDEIANEMADATAFNLVDGVLNNTFTLPANTDAAGNYIPAWSGSTLAFAAGDRAQYYLAAADGVSAGNILWRRYYGNGPTGGKPKRGGKPKKGGTQTYAGWTNDTFASLQPGSAEHGLVENVTSLNFIPNYANNTVYILMTITVKENQKTYTFTVSRNVYLANHN